MANGSSNLDISALLGQADKSYGFPSGTMASLMKQESGGSNKYLDDPSAYHYAANAEGKRIAGHTGKVSTAFGPFGILESTAAKPGYGVNPLKSKNIQEQIRFAAEYLAARSKSAGSLSAGLSGYGEGDKYANQVLSRLPKTRVDIPENTYAGSGNRLMAQNDLPVASNSNQSGVVMPSILNSVRQAQATSQAQAPQVPSAQAVAMAEPQPYSGPMAQGADNAWTKFVNAAKGTTQVSANDLKFGVNPNDFVAQPAEIKSQNPNAEVASPTGFMPARQGNPQAMALLNKILGDQQVAYSV